MDLKVFKNLILNKPAFLLSGNLYLRYLKFVALICLKYISIKPIFLKSSSEIVYKVKLYYIFKKNETIFTTSPYRVSRFIRGFENAGLRSITRYHVESILRLNTNIDVIDIGANVGEFTAGVLRMCKSRVYCFEPDPTAFFCLKQNFKSSCNDLNLINKAIGNKSNSLKFYCSPETADSSFIEPFFYSKIISVNTDTLREVIIDINSQNLMIKCEAEGYEPEILESAGSQLRQAAYVIVDAGPERRGCSTVDRVIQLLELQGFETILYENSIVHGINLEKVIKSEI
jgi:FkbM family methyltransferase